MGSVLGTISTDMLILGGAAMYKITIDGKYTQSEFQTFESAWKWSKLTCALNPKLEIAIVWNRIIQTPVTRFNNTTG